MASFCDALCEEHFAPFPMLKDFCSGALGDFLRESLDKGLAHIEEQLEAEREAYTLNHYYGDARLAGQARRRRQGRPQLLLDAVV